MDESSYTLVCRRKMEPSSGTIMPDRTLVRSIAIVLQSVLLLRAVAVIDSSGGCFMSRCRSYWVLQISVCIFILSVSSCENAMDCCTGEADVGAEGGWCYPNQTCNAGLVCQDHQCVALDDVLEVCTFDCYGIECGLDPVCGESCGICADGFRCETWNCVEGDCVPDCSGRECGLDQLCGLSCGSCDDGYSCQYGKCEKLVSEGDMVFVPAGKFLMGCNLAGSVGCSEGSSPYHGVSLSAYYIDKTEVTVGAFQECVEAGECSHHMDDGTCRFWDGITWVDAVLPQNYRGMMQPMVCVSWEQAKDYCEWVGKRLPTEAEWEKAARGTDGRRYPWGNEGVDCDHAIIENYEIAGSGGCYSNSTWDVCSKSPAGDSPYGLCDMAGNVGEWVSDWWAADYYYHQPTEDPKGPFSGDDVVFRGGAAHRSSLQSFETWSRARREPTGGNNALGFRCAKSL